jgi:hypothetical protein
MVCEIRLRRSDFYDTSPEDRPPRLYQQYRQQGALAAMPGITPILDRLPRKPVLRPRRTLRSDSPVSEQQSYAEEKQSVLLPEIGGD